MPVGIPAMDVLSQGDEAGIVIQERLVGREVRVWRKVTGPLEQPSTLSSL